MYKPTHGWSFIEYIDTDECTEEITPYDLCDQAKEQAAEKITRYFSHIADNLFIDLDSCDGPDEAHLYVIYEDLSSYGEEPDALSDEDERELDDYLRTNFFEVRTFRPEA